MTTPRRAQLDLDPSAEPEVHAVAHRASEADEVADGAGLFEVDAPQEHRWARRTAAAAVLTICGVMTTALGLQMGDDRGTAQSAISVVPTTQPVALSRAGQRSLIDPSVATPSASGTPTASTSASPRPSSAPSTVRPSTPATPAAAPSRTPSPKASASAKPTVDATSVGRPAGVRWTTSAVNVRKAPDVDALKIDTTPADAKVTITSRTSGAWQQVTVDGRTGWVRSDYLTSTKPKPAASVSATSTKSTRPVGSTSTSGSACSSSAVERGLSSNAIAVHRAVCGRFPAVTSFGDVRASADEHGSGHALDCMISGSAGWELANWARAHASELGITEVIYSQRIWTTQRSGEGFRSMSDRGGATANHYDHVHITVR